jgi:hypothetical protein
MDGEENCQDSPMDDESENLCNSTSTTTTTTIADYNSAHSKTTIHHKNNHNIDNGPIHARSDQVHDSGGTMTTGEACSTTTAANCTRDGRIWKIVGEITLVVATAAVGAVAYNKLRKRKS